MFGSLDPAMAPSLLRDALEALDWGDMDPEADGLALRELLVAHQQIHGISEAHTTTSRLLRDQLTLINPFGHDGETDFSALSPDKRWLATGSFSSETYERGGVIQIWETSTGRVINQFRVHGGVGWPDYKTFEWSPDSRWLASAFNTNAVGVWDPFDDCGPIRVAYVTDGWDAPPWFTWSPDGQAIWIRCDITRAFKDDELGCWFEVFGPNAHDVTSGYLREREGAPPPTLPTPVALREPVVTKSSVVFPDLDDGTGRGRYLDRGPGQAHPLVSPQGEDISLRFTIRPYFPVCVPDRPRSWGLVFADGAIAAPEGFVPGVQLNLSLAHRYSWPLEWADWIVTEPSPHALFGNEDAPIPEEVRDIFGALEPPMERAPARWPPDTGEGVDDVIAFALRVSQGRRHSLHYERMTEVAFIELLRGKPESAAQIMEAFASYRRIHWAEVGAQCLLRGHREIGRRLVEGALEKGPYSYCFPASYLATAFHLLGDRAQAARYRALAEEKREPQSNRNQNDWLLLEHYLACGEAELAYQRFVEWGVSSESFAWRFLHHLLWYHDLDELLRWLDLLADRASLGDSKKVRYLVDGALKHKAYDRLHELASRVKGYDRIAFWDRLLSALVEQGIDVEGIIHEQMLRGEPEPFNARRLMVIAKHSPATAARLIPSFDVRSEIQQCDYRGSFHELGCLLAKADLVSSYQDAVDALPTLDRLFFLVGVVAGEEPSRGRETLETVVSTLDGFDASAARVRDYVLAELYQQLAVAALRCESPMAGRLFDDALDRTMDRDKDLTVAAFVKFLLDGGYLEKAHETWQMIAPSSRSYRVDPLVIALVRGGHWGGLVEMLTYLEGISDHNVIEAVTHGLGMAFRNRGYHFGR